MAVRVIAGHVLRESLRRRVFVVVVGLSIVFGGLYAFGVAEAFHDVRNFAGGSSTQGVDAHTFVGATILGLGMFGVFFLGAVLAVFLTLGAVRGDAERGILQPLLVRPVSRPVFLAARFLAAAVVAAAYAAAGWIVTMVLVGAIGGWWPDRIVTPGLDLMGAVVVIAALSLLGSIFLSATANGIAAFMILGAGLVSGLLGQVGDAISSGTLSAIGRDAALALPFEALYQSSLNALTANIEGVAGAIVKLGPLGGARPGGALLWPWVVVYIALVGALGSAAFARRDL